MTMTNLQLRQRLADLAAEYSAKRRALLAEYNAIDQGANPRLFGPERGYYEAWLEAATIAKRTEMRCAAPASYHEADIPTLKAPRCTE